MSNWSVTLSPGGDITAFVDVPSIKRELRLHSEMQPNVNKCDFRVLYDATLFAALVSAAAPITCTITKDGAAYFTGIISPNFSTTISQDRKYITLIAEDATISGLGQTIASALLFVGYSVCDPASPSTSLLHALCALAGVTIAATPPTIATIIPFLSVLPADKLTYKAILSQLLYEYRYVYYFSEAGALMLYATINSGAISTSGTFDATAGGGNIRDKINIGKSPEKYDDIRVKYKSAEQRFGIVLFQDTSGGSGNLEANIEVKANGDGGGGDYYPLGSGVAEVFSEWRNPDGYQILCATAAALDVLIGGGLSLSRAFSNYYRRASFAYHNANAASSYITRLRIKGDAWVQTAANVARSNITSGKLLLEYEAKYIFDTANAQALAQALQHYYGHSDFNYILKSQTDYPIGAYIQVTDSLFSGVSQKCRIIGKSDGPATKSIEYALEAVADFASISLVLESTALTIQASIYDQLRNMSDDGIISPQEKGNLKANWFAINGDGVATGSYWATRISAMAASVPTDALDAARALLNNFLYGVGGALLTATWALNVTISPAFYDAWAGYYKAEADTISTISRFASFGHVAMTDCGVYDPNIAPTVVSELDGGAYIIDNNQDMTAGNDFGTYSGSPDSTLNCGQWSPSLPDSTLDGQVWKAPDGNFIFPRLFYDCGQM